MISFKRINRNIDQILNSRNIEIFIKNIVDGPLEHFNIKCDLHFSFANETKLSQFLK
jgi:hypothetical protein